MTECRYTRARTLDEAVASLAEAGGEAHVIAGGIALVILMNERLIEPTWLVDVSAIDEMKGIEATDEGGLRIGALVTHDELERSATVAAQHPMLVEMAAEIACGRIKNKGTIGGSICLADPQGDPPIAMLALDATFRAVGPVGRREIPARRFFTGLYETALAEDELLQDIIVPRPPANGGAAFGKYAARRAMDYTSTISAGVELVREPKGGRIAAVGLGGVGTAPLWPAETEAVLLGETPSPEIFERLREAVFDQAEPLADALYSADYKRHVAAVILKRTVQAAYGRAGGGGF